MTNIGIDNLWYGTPLAADITNAAGLISAINAMTQVANSHEGTFAYEQDDNNETEYKNELTGETYFVDVTSYGAKRIRFSIGEYDFDTYTAFMGGEKVGTEGWKTNSNKNVPNKAFIAQTKSGNFIVFSNAKVTAKNDTQDKGIMIGITARCMESSESGVAAEYRFLGDKIKIGADGKASAVTGAA